MKLAIAFAALLGTPASAATLHQGDKWVGQLSGQQTLTFEAPYATPCGNGNWSGCSYQAGGSILAVDDPTKCGGWCGETLHTFNIDAYQPQATWTFDFTKWANKFVLVHLTGQNPVNFTLAAEEMQQPAPVPLPAPAILLLAALGSFFGLRRHRRAEEAA
ncbi:hypothetical protein [Paracoccus beibuensis]|uniref:hypothetical protein n=1 Tax=Paracoccus beibuensis TaxID=547602 RepID=UPI00223F6166|nr:hypothetical protein [Paracoccus beibuensis]